MRRILLIFLFLSFSISFGEIDVNVAINGSVEDDLDGMIVEGHTYVKLQPLLKIIGFDYENGRATRGETVLEFGDTVLLNGEEVMLPKQPITKEEGYYVPLAGLLRQLGHTVTWDAESFRVEVDEKLDRLHLYYGPSSYNNYVNYDLEALDFDSIGFAWAAIDYKDGIIELNTSSKNSNSMYIPSGYDLVMNHNNFLNIYVDDYYEQLFLQKDQLIKQIKSTIESPTIDRPSFEGVILDFENLALDYELHYIDFIKDLKDLLDEDTKLYVALQPFGYDIKSILNEVDGIVLMYHDYESKLERIWQLDLDHIHQPISPIKRIEEDLIQTLEGLSESEKSKLLLQINLAVVQWQGTEDHKRYTPNYDLLLNRLDTLEEDNFYYDDNTQNPYVVYTADDKNNTIWYENTGSIQAKLDLVKQFNLGGISLWHIGNLPETPRPEYQLNILEEILKNY